MAESLDSYICIGLAVPSGSLEVDGEEVRRAESLRHLME